MKKFTYHEPRSIQEACRLLYKYAGRSSLLAGGTDLIVKMKKGALAPRHVINLKTIPGLNGIRKEVGGYGLGALATLADIAQNAGLKNIFPLLNASAQAIGSSQVRNIATLGGNICNAAPSADMAPALLCLDARVKIAGPETSHSMPLKEFFMGPGMVDLKPGEILAEIYVPFPCSGTKGIFVKHSPRRKMDIAVTSVAVLLAFDEKGFCKKVRIALGSVAPTPIRAEESEALIKGKKAEDVPFHQITEILRQEVNPISDVRASAEYREEMVSVLTVHAIKDLLLQWGVRP